MSVLDRLGGRASVQDVLDGVYTVIKPDLTTVDYIPWPSDPRHPRWESRVRNCIGRLRDKHLLKRIPYKEGLEISDLGREWLEHNPGA